MDFLTPVSALWRPALEIGVFWFVFYLLLVYIKDSGMAQAVKGLILLAVLFFLAQILDLTAIAWVLSHIFQISILGFLIIFQPELRRGLTRIGQNPLFRFFVKEEKVATEIIQAVVTLSKEKRGALIAVEREVSLKSYAETGTPLDGVVTAELLLTLFAPNTPLHDGAVIIQGARVAASGCLFPLSQSQKLSKALGTRHRAGLGLSEETDALVIVVSEETGTISMMEQGKITRGVDAMQLRQKLTDFHMPDKAALEREKT